MKFLYYEGRHGEQHLTEHTPEAWEFLKREMERDNNMSFDEVAEEFGAAAIEGSLDYAENGQLSVDDGGSIITIELTEVSS